MPTEEIIYTTKGYIEVEGREFEYSAILYFGDTRRTDKIEVEPTNDEDQTFFEENIETIEEKISTLTHEQYWNKVQCPTSIKKT